MVILREFGLLVLMIPTVVGVLSVEKFGTNSYLRWVCIHASPPGKQYRSLVRGFIFYCHKGKCQSVSCTSKPPFGGTFGARMCFREKITALSRISQEFP